MKQIIITAILTLAFTAFAIQAVEQTAFSGAGVIESTTGGFKFPDGSVQLSATLPPCTAVTSLPFIIDESGVYCLTGNLSTDNGFIDAIKVNADNVVIDLNGWMLDNLAAGSGTLSRGIWAYQRKNITIRNGTIRGFHTAIYLNDTDPYSTSQGHLVEGMLATQNTFLGIMVYGANSTVRHNRVLKTNSSDTSGTGIELNGTAGRVFENDIRNLSSTSAVRGISISKATGTVVEGNRIVDISAVNGSTGIYIQESDGSTVKNNQIKYIESVGSSWGIRSVSSNDSVIEHNFIKEVIGGLGTVIGIEASGQNHLLVNNRIQTVTEGISIGDTSSKYRDNLTANVTTPFTGGTDAGGNN